MKKPLHQSLIKRPQGRFVVALVSVAISSAIHAADEPVSILSQVEVWATAVSASSVKLQSDKIAIKQADHISDLLRTVPGVDVGGSHSLNQRITIRSMDDKDLRISIDGANQNTYMYHHMGNLHINADILEQVDVNIGNNSVLDGGLGGAVRFKTKSADQLLREGERYGGRAQISAGDNSGESLSLTGFGKLSDTVDILGYVNRIDRDNFEVGGGQIKDFNGNLVSGTDGKVRGLKGELTDALIKFGWNVDPDQRLSISYENYVDKGNYSFRPDMGLATDLAITSNLMIPLLWPTELERDTLTLNYDLEWGENSTTTAALFRNNSNLKRDESGYAQNPAFAPFAALIEGEATNTGANLFTETTSGDHTLSYGIELIDYDTHYVSTPTAGGTATASGEDARNAAIYIQDRFWLSDWFAVIPGIRHNYFDINSTVVNKSYEKTTGALALEYDATDNLLISLSSTQLFKGPEIGEVFIGSGLSDAPNQDIEAETGTNTELSVAFEDALFGADRFATGVTVFQTRLKNYIYDYASSPASVPGRSWKDNVGNMTIEGLEFYVGYDKGALKTLLTFSKATSELDAFTQYASLNGARLDRTQGDSISLNVDYDVRDSLALHWDVLVVADVKKGADLDGASANNAKEGYSVHYISLRWNPEASPKSTLTFGVDNLFDEYYASQSSRTGLSRHPRFGDLYLQDYEPGRNIKVTYAYDF